MIKYKDGVYYNPIFNSLLIITNISKSEPPYNVCFVNFESKHGFIEGVWVYEANLKNLVYLGEL